MLRELTPQGSAFSQDIWEPQEEDGLIFSGNDSGMKTSINNISKAATAVAISITTFWLYTFSMKAPIAGLVIKLAANVADTYKTTA